MKESEATQVMVDNKQLHRLELMQAILAVLSRRDISIDEQINEILRTGCELFHEQVGILARIEDNVYTVEYVYSPDIDIRPGQQFDLSETFCAITLESNDALGIRDVEKSPWKKHPCIETGLKSYIGTPIFLNGSRFGTLNFSSPEPRDESFLEIELDIARMLADWTSNILAYSSRVGAEHKGAPLDLTTGLPGRGRLMNCIDQHMDKLRRNEESTFALLMIDFSYLNPVLDHADDSINNAIAQHIARRIKGLTKNSDLVVRLGPDEFCVLLSQVKRRHLDAIALRVLQAINRPYEVKGANITLTCTAGLTLIDTPCSANDALARGRLALDNARANHEMLHTG